MNNQGVVTRFLNCLTFILGFALFEMLLFKYSECLDVLILRGHCNWPVFFLGTGGIPRDIWLASRFVPSARFSVCPKLKFSC